MGRYSCTRREQITYTSLGSALIGVGVPLTVFPILIATNTFNQVSLNGESSDFSLGTGPGQLGSVPTATYFALSVLGTAATLVGLTLLPLYATAKTTD
jgi:hypothetical protein